MAGRYDRLMYDPEVAKIRALISTGDPALRHFRTPEITAKLSQKWPRYMANSEFLDAALNEERLFGTAFAAYKGSLPTESSYGEARSNYFEFITHALKLFSKHPDFTEALAAREATKQPAFRTQLATFFEPGPVGNP